MEEQQYYDDFYAASKGFINNFNLVDITKQHRDRQRAESNQIAVQVGNVLEIVPNAEIPAPEQKETVEVDPKLLKEKRKMVRERKRKLKKKRKEQLRKEIQRYFDEGINIEDSEDDEILVEPLRKIENTVKGIIKTSKSDKKIEKRVMFGDGFYPFESSDHEEMSLQEKSIRKAIRKRIGRKSSTVFNAPSIHSDAVVKTQKKAEQYENISPPSPPPGQPSEKFPQPELKHIPPDLFASFSINFNPIYYFLQKLQYQQNGHSSLKTSNTPSVRNLNSCKYFKL